MLIASLLCSHGGGANPGRQVVGQVKKVGIFIKK